MDNINFSYKLADAEFVVSENEYCYQKVLDDFENAEYINILTYNISKNGNHLLNAIKTVGNDEIPIRIITNIPGRFETYSWDWAKKKVKENIELYQKKLSPDSIGELSSLFFNFKNHGKIIMTNNIIYWGSSNYSDESRNNIECGTISRDKKFINFVNNIVIQSIIRESLLYNTEEYNTCIATMFSAISEIHSQLEEIFESSFRYDCDYSTNFEEIEYVNPYDNCLDWNSLKLFLETICEFESILQDLQTDFSKKGIPCCYELEKIIKDYHTVVISSNDIIKKLCSKIKPLAIFDEETYVSDLLQNEYYAEAYDEKLDYYAQLAFEKGRERKAALIESSKSSIEELIKCLDNYEEELCVFTNKLTIMAKASEKIDNTKQ